MVPGLGQSRFAPLPETAHAYVATTRLAALLESALHDAAPPAPRIRVAQLRRWAEAEVALTSDLRLIDLRDAELRRLGLTHRGLVATSAAHYPCTRTRATALQGRVIGGQETHGLVWHSRQLELHARVMHDRPALQEMLRALPAEVAMLWAPPAARTVLRAASGGLGPLTGATGDGYVTDLAALLGITIL